MFILATKYINSSKNKSILEMNKKSTAFNFKYAECGHRVEPSEQVMLNPQNNQNLDCSHSNKKFICSICLKEVKGLMLLCPICFHGGHFQEIYEWFTQKPSGDDATSANHKILCPMGCNHQCFDFK